MEHFFPVESNGRANTKVVEAQKFVLKDADGNTRAFLGLSEDDEPILRLLGREENSGVEVRIDGPESAPEINLFHGPGNSQILLRVCEHGVANVQFLDMDGNTHAVLGVQQGTGQLAFCDGEGTVRAVFGLNDDDQGPRLILADEKGDLRALLYLEDDGSPVLDLPTEEELAEDKEERWDAGSNAD